MQRNYTHVEIFVVDNVMKCKVNLCHSIDVQASPDNWEHQRHEWNDGLDLASHRQQSLTRLLLPIENIIFQTLGINKVLNMCKINVFVCVCAQIFPSATVTHQSQHTAAAVAMVLVSLMRRRNQSSCDCVNTHL